MHNWRQVPILALDSAVGAAAPPAFDPHKRVSCWDVSDSGTSGKSSRSCMHKRYASAPRYASRIVAQISSLTLWRIFYQDASKDYSRMSRGCILNIPSRKNKAQNIFSQPKASLTLLWQACPLIVAISAMLLTCADPILLCAVRTVRL